MQTSIQKGLNLMPFVINPENLYQECFQLAQIIFKSDFVPDCFICLWRGGAVPTQCIDEYFRSKDLVIPTEIIKISSYAEDHTQGGCQIDNPEVFERIPRGSNLLIIDDLVDSGMTIKTTMSRLNRREPKALEVAALYYKPDRTPSTLKPTYWISKVDTWIQFPHELS